MRRTRGRLPPILTKRQTHNLRPNADVSHEPTFPFASSMPARPLSFPAGKGGPPTVPVNFQMTRADGLPSALEDVISSYSGDRPPHLAGERRYGLAPSKPC